ncbi:MAG: hypothetical protein E6H70_05250 [Betaproteobacteria bacterium]|nr:MAG: hypothetical protein E6H70_05250 [Betaproteobacteria bacterium]
MPRQLQEHLARERRVRRFRRRAGVHRPRRRRLLPRVRHRTCRRLRAAALRAQGQTVVLGLVSSKVPELERKDDLKRRIDAAAKFVPLENLCLSPQCGFSSTHHGNKLTADDQWRKLGLVLEVSNSVWG